MVLDFDEYTVNQEFKAFCCRCGKDISDRGRFVVNDDYYCEECFDYEFGFDGDVICEGCGEVKATHILPVYGCYCEGCAKGRCED